MLLMKRLRLHHGNENAYDGLRQQRNLESSGPAKAKKPQRVHKEGKENMEKSEGQKCHHVIRNLICCEHEYTKINKLNADAGRPKK